MSSEYPSVTPEIILKAYTVGIFPMAESADDTGLFWVEPKMRGIIPLDEFHVGKRLARTVRSNRFIVKADTDFGGVIEGCSQARSSGEKTWISRKIQQLYGELFNLGYCHTIAVYDGGKLVGGLYGIMLGSAFFGESMFHYESDASKVALVHLVARMKAGGFTLLDTQFLSDHLMQFGAIEISRHNYTKLLKQALERNAHWDSLPPDLPDAGRAVMDILSS